MRAYLFHSYQNSRDAAQNELTYFPFIPCYVHILLSASGLLMSNEGQEGRPRGSSVFPLLSSFSEVGHYRKVAGIRKDV